jgi:hypothetical protein
MRYIFTLNMPSKAGNPVHQIIGDHPAKTLEDLISVLIDDGVVVVDEIYRDNNSGNYYSVGPIAITSSVIGKIKTLNQ